MHYKSRTKSEELKILEILSKRMVLPDQERNYYLYLKKGFEGEILFDSLTENFQSDCLVLNDLLLNINKTTFQVDSLIITSNKVYFYEVKNYEGDYFYESEKMFKFPKTEITNPLIQLRRAETLLKQLLLSLGFNLSVEGLVVFINPEFTLYQTPLNYPFLFPTQIKRYFKKFESNTTKLSNKHRLLADKMISLHSNVSPFTNLPGYEYHQLQKGITCGVCNSFMSFISGHNIHCNECGCTELTSSAIMRSINEFKTLFPSEKVTTNIIHDWCKVISSKKRIQRVLDNNFRIVGTHQWAYYI
nr:nuclease-related domain-containing protein [Lysinibacillus timonensis]